jgi:hypothetical protein
VELRRRRPQVVERLAVDPAVVADAVLEVLNVHEPDERGLHGRVESLGATGERADARQLADNLDAEGRVDLDQIFRRGGKEVEFVHLEQPRKLFDRGDMVVDAQVDVAMFETGVASARFFDDQRGALLAAFIATARLGGAKRGYEAIGEVAVRGAKRRRQRVDDR